MSSSNASSGNGQAARGGAAGKTHVVLTGADNWPMYKGYIRDYARSMRCEYLLAPGAVPKTEDNFYGEIANRMAALRQRVDGQHEHIELKSELQMEKLVFMAMQEEAKVQSLLMHMKDCIKPDLAEYYADVHSPTELWAALENAFEKISQASASALASEFRNLRFDDSTDVGSFVHKFSLLRTKLKLLGHTDADPNN
ncbi:hypothetical protein HDU96_004423, partial [Phlyctochytrium bullatum]